MPDPEHETGFLILSYDITGEWQQIAFFDDDKLLEAYTFALKTLKEYNIKRITDPNFCKTITIKTIEWFDVWNYCRETFKEVGV